MSDSSMPLGAVEVEVRANLSKLGNDFRAGKAQAQAFAKDMGAAVGPGNAAFAKSMAGVNTQTKGFQDNMVTVNRWIQQVDSEQQRANATWATASKTIAANAAAVASVERATRPEVANQRLVTAALRDAEKSYAQGTITVAALGRAQQIAAPFIANTATQYETVVKKLDPAAAAQMRYSQQLGTIAAAEKAGVATGAEANAMRGAALNALNAEVAGLGKASEAHTNYLRRIEMNVRAVRLLGVVFGVDMVGRLGSFVIKTLESTAALGDQATALGLTTTELQEYRGIAGQVGLATTDMDKAFETLGKNLDDLALGRVGPFSKLLKRFRIDLKDAAGQAKSNSQIFGELVQKFGQVGDKAQQKGGALIAFGEAGAKMGKLFETGTPGMHKLMQAIADTGGVISPELIAHSDDAAKKLEDVKTVLSANLSSTIAANATAIVSLSSALASLAGSILTFMGTNPEEALAIIGALGGAMVGGTPGAVIGAVGGVIAGARMEQMQRDSNSNLGFRRQALADSMTELRSRQAAAKDTGGLISFHHGTAEGAAAGGDVDSARHEVLRQMGLLSNVIAAQRAKMGPAKPTGPNIDLKGILSPKGKKAPKEKFDQFDQELAQEHVRQLEIEKESTTDLVEQTRIEKEIIDDKLIERDKQIERQVHNKELTAAEGEKLKAEAKITADMEKEEADRKLEIGLIERQFAYYSEIASLETDNLNIARDLARTDKERAAVEFKLLDIKQEQARLELEKQIRIAQENKDQERATQLMGEYVKLLANQAGEVKDFKVQHLVGFDKFVNDLPRTVNDINAALDKIRFDQFTERLQRAADMAKQIGDDFGTFVGDLVSLKNPLDAVKSLIQNLAKTFTENVIVKPVSDWATQHLGVPLAKQAFGKQLTSGPDALTAKQFDVALAQATGTLGGLDKALPGASTAMDAVTTAANPASTSITALGTAADTASTALTNMAATAGAGGAGGGAGGLGGLTSLFGPSSAGGDAAGFSAGDLTSGMTSDFTAGLGALSDFGFADGGFTGPGGSGEVQGVVHSNEFVLNADAVSQYGLPLLGAMNDGGASIVRSGGAGGPSRAAGGGGIGSAAGAAPDLSAAASMLMQAAQMLMQATKGMGGGGMGGGLMGGLLGMVAGSLLGGKGGGGLSSLFGLAGNLFGKGGGGGGGGGGILAAGVPDGSMSSTLSLLGDSGGGGGWASGGFTGTGGDHEVAGPVHKNEWVWDAPTTRRFWPVLQLIGAGRIPSFQGPGLGQMMNRGDAVSRPLHVHLGDIHLHDVTDDRSARRTARQALGVIHRGIAEVTRKGLSQ